MSSESRFATSIAIAGRQIGPREPVYLIAEAGANHNRDLSIARELIEVAADAGADAIKFQTYTGSGLYSSKTPPFKYLHDDRPPHKILEELALPREWQPELAEHAKSRRIAFFSAPFDYEAIDGLAALGVPAMKIASYELIDLPLIRHAAAVGVPMILSTGMATYGEIDDALDAVASERNREVALLRCASVYPAPAEIMNLGAMSTMRGAFGVPVGLSDHSEGVAVPTAAAALGADLIEKHFTLSRKMPGPDHSFALEPAELRNLVTSVREVEAALGNGRLEGPSEVEAGEMYTLARRSVVAATDIAAGTTITREMLTTKRPGYGIKPKDLELLIGRSARVDIEYDDIITWEMV